MTIVYRPPTPDELNRFVVASWSASYRDAYTAGFIQDEDYFAIMDSQVTKGLARPGVRTIVAWDSDAEPGVDLLGFVAADTNCRPDETGQPTPPLVYYVYVKLHYRRGRGRLWRGPGLARQLFDAIGVDPERPFNYVCSTPMCRTLAPKIPLARWRPLLGRKQERSR